MLPASTRMAGMCQAFRDVCKTPTPAGPVPIPYPNIAQNPMMDPGSATTKVLIMNMPCGTAMTKIHMSNGDEAGSAGGVVSSKIMGPAMFKTGSPKVLFEGKPAAMLLSMTGQNDAPVSNAPAGSQVVPSQAVVLVSP
jgi:Domain of unknown function (DUF4150)